LHRRTALVALRGELDLVTVSKVAEVLDGLEPQADGVRHVVLDLRGLTFMDVSGLRELLSLNPPFGPVGVGVLAAVAWGWDRLVLSCAVCGVFASA
jgi:anti-anti-sigma factor